MEESPIRTTLHLRHDRNTAATSEIVCHAGAGDRLVDSWETRSILDAAPSVYPPHARRTGASSS